MSETDLKQLLGRLHNELDKAGEVDEETRQLLALVSNDISSVLKSGQREGEMVDSSTLKKLAVEFEAEHPRLARTLNEVAESLAKIGI